MDERRKQAEDRAWSWGCNPENDCWEDCVWAATEDGPSEPQNGA